MDSNTGTITITSSLQALSEDENDTVKLSYNGADYATINVEVKKATIAIDSATTNIEIGETTTISAMLEEYQKGEISWTVIAGTNSVSIPEGSKNNSIEITGLAAGTAVIEVTYTTGSVSLKKTKSVVVKTKYVDKSYVEYNVEYVDVYSEKFYKADTGWRLLTDLSAYEDSGTYNGNIEIISAGIPAMLNYYYTNISSAPWAGNNNQRLAYTQRYYNSESPYYNIYAAAGLLNNFGKIVFSYTGEKNNLTSTNIVKNDGGYISINNGGTSMLADSVSTKNATELFETSIASGLVTGIRTLTHEDINGSTTTISTNTITSYSSTATNITYMDKKKGLFRLGDYTPGSYGGRGEYWIAAPTKTTTAPLYYIMYNGIFEKSNGGGSYGNESPKGIRPVIAISNVKLRLNGNVWKIVANNS